MPRATPQLASTTLGWRLVNPAMPAEWTVSLGEGAEILADKFGIDRDRQDAFAVRSHRLAHAAWERGVFAEEVVPVDRTGLERDEGIRPDTTVERLAGLRPAFREGGTVTGRERLPAQRRRRRGAGRRPGRRRPAGWRPLARVAASAVHAVEPQLYGIAPVEAANQALARAGIGWADLSVVELNEAFAAQALACLDSWPSWTRSIVNPNGGAVALGIRSAARGPGSSDPGPGAAPARRPVGAGGDLHRVGQGLAVVLEA
jgi:acetyl-CoA acetyltransferase